MTTDDQTEFVMDTSGYPEALRPLKQALLVEYGHFADRRFKNIDKSAHFIVDDREDAPAFARDGSPYGWFCEIFADVEAPARVLLSIVGPLPTGAHVQAWLQGHGVAPITNQFSYRLRHNFTVEPSNLEKLPQLADALMKDRKTSSVKSDYYVCPRIADSLIRLYRTLSAHWRTG